MNSTNKHKLALGTVQFGLDYGISNKSGKTTQSEVQAILDTCRREGIDMLDTASAYGEAEKILGDVGIDGFKVVSKFMPNENEVACEQQLKHTLKKLNVNELYAYLAHRPLELLKNPWEWAYLQKQKQEGVIQNLGLSLNKPSELQTLIEKGINPDIIQAPYNFLDRRFETLFKKLKEKGIEIHTRSTFLQGLFFMNPTALSAHFDEAKPMLTRIYKEENLLGKLLQFALKSDFVDKVVVGVENSRQLLENISSLRKVSSALSEYEVLIFKEEILMPYYWPK